MTSPRLSTSKNCKPIAKEKTGDYRSHMDNNIEKSTRKFAAKYNYKWPGWMAVLFGISWIGSGEVYLLVLGILLAVFGIYLIRGQGKSPRSLERTQKKADKLKSKIDAATSELENASGARAVVAYRNLENLLKSTKLPDHASQFEQILTDIKFDRSTIQSEHIGSLSGPGMLNKTPIEIYKNWIISGQTAFDVDVSTRGEVSVEGNIQIDAKGNKHDLRKAFVHFVSTNWSHTFPLHVEQVSDARRIVGQLSAVIEAMKPSGVTSADISKMMETILNSSGQPPAEKLKQLSDLRFQRLLSDSEFEAAKARILGI